MCCSPRGLKKSDTTERLNGTEVGAAAGLQSRSRRVWGVTGFHLGFSECSWGPEGAAAPCVPTGTKCVRVVCPHWDQVCPWGRPVSCLLSVEPDLASPPPPPLLLSQDRAAPKLKTCLAWLLGDPGEDPSSEGLPTAPLPHPGPCLRGSWVVAGPGAIQMLNYVSKFHSSAPE